MAAHREAKRVADFVGNMAVVSDEPLPARVPSELRALDRWIRHQDKRPMAVGGWFCSVTDPSHWGSFADASKSTYGDGLGFVLNGDGIVCLDLDDCVVDGVPSHQAKRLLDMLPDTYVEFSPSGRGLHVWGYGFMNRGRRFTMDGLKVEAYPDGRYLTVTGDVYRNFDFAVLDLSSLLVR